MRNVTQFFRDSDETRVGIFGPDSTHLAFFVMWRPFLWLFGHVENFSTRPIALASFVARRKKRGLSGHIEKFSTCRIHLALFVAWQKVRGVSVAVRPVNHCTLARRHRYQPSAKTPVPKTRETLDARHKRSHPISALLLCNTDIRARCDLDAILMRSWCDLDAILMRWKTSFWGCIRSSKVTKIHVFDAKLLVLFEKSILLDEKHHSEGVSEARKSKNYMFSTQNYSFSSKKA